MTKDENEERHIKRYIDESRHSFEKAVEIVFINFKIII